MFYDYNTFDKLTLGRLYDNPRGTRSKSATKFGDGST
jgi:hypothetical protein